MYKVNEAYMIAKERYSELGIDTDSVMEQLSKIPVSINCWQGDDVSGFEEISKEISGAGIMSTGNRLGKARNGDELRKDLDMAMSQIPGIHKVNLHAMYAETKGEKIDRDDQNIDGFSKWIEWAKNKGIGFDFNPTFFAHEMANSGFTLSSDDEKIRKFWIEHAKKSREIAQEMGRQLGVTCINNLWIQDGCKDTTVSKYKHRKLLKESLDEIYREKMDPEYIVDCVESKLFGIGSESFVVGSHEFYLSYVNQNDVSLCLDMGHFHPTEGIADKISSILTFKKDLLLHVSRPIRWDSDHVVTFNDDLLALMCEVNRADAMNRVYFAVDFFDGSINRIQAWVIGLRNTIKAIMFALLEPLSKLKEAEESGNFGTRLAIFEEAKSLPFAAVWDKYCLDKGVNVGVSWIDKVNKYDDEVLSKR